MFANEPGTDPIQDLLAETQDELEQVSREVKEISLLVEQSRTDVSRLAQRHATISNQLRNLQLNFDTVPRADIKSAYEAAQDAQQRLFTLRGQLDKFQSDQTNLERYLAHLKKTLSVLQSIGTGAAHANGDGGGPSAIVRVIEAQEAERQRLSRQMHDGPAQDLSNFILQAEIAMRLFDHNPERARDELTNLRTSAASTFQKLRDFIFDLRPMMLDDLGLVPTIRRYVDGFNGKGGVNATAVFTGTERRLESVREVLVFRAVQELLGNARDYAQATEVNVRLDMDEQRVQVIVEDNGKVFEGQQAQEAGQKMTGLPALNERIQMAGGQIEIHRQPGQGTQVRLAIPAGQAQDFS